MKSIALCVLKSVPLHVVVWAAFIGAACVQLTEPNKAALPIATEMPTTIASESEFGARKTGYRKQWAVFIGIDSYSAESGFQPLKNAVNDARAVRAMLRDEFGYQDDGIDDDADDDVLLLLNERAKKKAIDSALSDWLSHDKLHEHDAVLLFFSGHGAVQDGEGYLAAVDSRSSDLVTTGISLRTLRKQLSDLPCRHKAIILDCCSSADLFSDAEMKESQFKSSDPGIKAGNRDGWSDKTLGTWMSGDAFVAIAASRTGALDESGKDQHSLLTHHMLQVLKERADSEREDHAFRFRKFANLVIDRVANDHGSYQQPLTGYLEPGVGDYVFFERHRRPTPRERSKRVDFAKRRATYASRIQALSRCIDVDARFSLDVLNNSSLFQPEFRGFLWGLLAERVRGSCCESEFVSPLAIKTCGVSNAGQVVCAAMDGRLLAFAMSEDGQQLIQSHRSKFEDVFLCCAVSPEGVIATGSPSGAATIYNLGIQGFSQETSLKANSTPITAIAFSSVAPWMLATGNVKGELRLWDLRSKECIQAMVTQHGVITAVHFSNDGKQIVIGTHNGYVEVREAAGGGDTKIIPLPQEILGVRTLGENVVAVNCNGKLAVWDVITKKKVADLADGVVAIDWLSRSTIVVAQDNGDVDIRRWPTLEIDKSFNLNGLPAVAIAMSHNKRWLACVSSHTLKLFDLHQTSTLRANFSRSVASPPLALAATNSSLAVATSRGKLNVLTIPALEIKGSIDVGGFPTTVALSMSSNHAAVGLASGLVRVYSIAKGALRETCVFNCTQPIICVAFREDHGLIALTESGIVYQLSMSDEVIKGSRKVGDYILCGSVARHADTLVFATEDGRVARMQCSSHDFEEIANTSGPVVVVSVDSRSRRAAAISHAHGPAIIEFPYDNPTALKSFHKRVSALDISPSGTLVAGTADGTKTITVWDVASGNIMAELPVHVSQASCVKFSPDESCLFVGGWNGSNLDSSAIECWHVSPHEVPIDAKN